MNTKRNRKNIADASSTSNNYKKTKTVVSTEANGNKEYNNIKSKKKENTNASLNENKITGGYKRKLPDTELITPTPKKSRKRGKTCKDVDSTVDVEGIPSMPSTDFGINKQPKKSKKSKMPLNNESFIDKENPNKPAAVLQPLFEKTVKNRKHANKDQLSSAAISTLIHKEGFLTPKQEVIPGNYKINVDENINHFESESIVMEAEQCEENGSIHLTIKDLEDSESELIEHDTQELVGKVESEISKNKAVIQWPKEDLSELVNRMEACIPENDALAFGTRAEKLEWNKIIFKNYSVEECKNTWYSLQKQIRRFRLLKEVLADAKEWIRTPKSKMRNKKKSRHPDMPRKPLTAYFIYYLERKDEFQKTLPGLDATEISKILGQEFKTLPPEKRLKYEGLAAKRKKDYEKQMDEFYQLHPDIPRIMKAPKIRAEKKPKSPKLPKPVKEKPPPKPPKERIPKRPPPPFHYYYLSELEKHKDISDPQALKETCKERWKELPDDKKVIWINNAEIEYAKYEEALTKYLQNHPECVQNPHKPILTKEEIQIKDRVAGKPSKPPGSAYNLFARMMLQSEEVKNVPIRDRLIVVSNQWKTCPEEQKKHYKDLSAKLNEKYKLDYASYLETLPEEERKMEIQKNVPKRRKSEAVEQEKKEKTPKKKSNKKAVTKKIEEPEQPPFSAFKYFASLYTGEEPASQAWKALSADKRKVYEDELVKKKQAYIADFEKFLQSLSKEELQEFSNSRKRIKQQPEEDEEEGTGTSDESGSGESDADSNDEDSEDSSV